MTQKRILSDQASFSVKKSRTREHQHEHEEAESSTTSFSILQWTNSTICWGCDMIDNVDINECIETDLEPHEYFNLAAVLLKPSQVDMYNNNSENEQLLRSASMLTKKEFDKVMGKIIAYIYQFTIKEIVEDMDKMLGETLFHKNREISFVIQTINSLKNNSDSRLVNLVQDSDYNHLKDILFLDVKFARLIPLLSAIINNDEEEKLPRDASIILSDGPEEEVDEAGFGSSSFSLTQVIDMTTTRSSSSQLSSDNDSHLILPIPSQVIPDSPLADNNISTELPSDIFSQQSFSVYENPSTPSAVTTEAPAEEAPNYDDLSTEEIKAKVRSYGFKPASRNQMITYLEQLRACSRNNSPALSSASQQQSRHSTPVTNKEDQQSIREKIEKYLRSDERVWLKILMYEPLDLDELYKKIDIPCKKSELKNILDECCAGVKKTLRVKKK